MGNKQKMRLQEKVSLIRRIINGEINLSEASRIAGVHWTTIDQWKRQYEAEEVDGMLPQLRNRVYHAE